MKKAFAALVGLALGAQLLTGCGSQNAASPQIKSNLKVATVSTASYGSLSEINRSATDALYRYNDLLRQWNYTSSNYQKDNIEMSMLETLTRALKNIKTTAGYGYDTQRIRTMATDALYRYDDLQHRWTSAYSDRERREIVNSMLDLLTRAVKNIQTESNRY
ncbi:MAG TPA: hypothetical protein DD435_03880 [Cyanobacteria bacterium UBA8530]|nr:hypothetical protein [Cyanobacteria bacterium UBA8530]